MPSLRLAGRPLRAAAIALVAAATGTTSAHAATLQLDGSTLVYRAAPGIINWPAVAIGSAPNTIRIADGSEQITPGAGCALSDPDDPSEVQCPTPAALRLELGDAPDQVLLRETLPEIPIEVRGGPGNDKLTANDDVDNRVTLLGEDGDDILLGMRYADVLDGGPGNDQLDGGAGDDTLRGGDGNDLLKPDGSSSAVGSDSVDGGAGYDTIEDWASADSGQPGWGVNVTIDGVAGDGRPGEQDNVVGIEQINALVPGRYVFGDSDDRIDVVGYGSSTIEGRGGDDELTGNDGTETIDGGAGDDRIEGGYGHDTLTGGPGRDTIYGDETTQRCSVLGECTIVPYGNDTIYARDGEQDVIDCGVGNDKAIVDPVDIVANCETVDGGASGSGSGQQPGGSGAAGGGASGTCTLKPSKLKGLTRAAATRRVKRAGCKVAVKTVRSRTVRKGRVVRATTKGKTITLEVSGGPRARRAIAERAAAAALVAKPRTASSPSKLRTYTYDVSYTGRATLAFREDSHLGDVPDQVDGSLSASIRWHGTVSRVRIRGARVISARRPAAELQVSMSSSTTRKLGDAPPSTRTCKADRELALVTGDAAVDNPDDLLVPLGGAVDLVVRPFADASISMTCKEDGAGIDDTLWVPGANGAELGKGIWDASFELPREAVGAGKVIQIVKESPEQHLGGGCPNVGTGADVARCELDWRQVVTFRKRR